MSTCNPIAEAHDFQVSLQPPGPPDRVADLERRVAQLEAYLARLTKAGPEGQLWLHSIHVTAFDPEKK